MAKIREDEGGLYALVGGYIARPPTQSGYYEVDGKATLQAIQVTGFKLGDSVTGKHFGGTTRVGMGKLEGKGNYLEYWDLAGSIY